MALCLASSLIVCQGFNPYDQLVRYKWWFRHGYMTATGGSPKIGENTKQSIEEFERRQEDFAQIYNISEEDMDFERNPQRLKNIDFCCNPKAAGNGALLRLAPVPLFCYLRLVLAVRYSGKSGQTTHGDAKAIDACRYYGALIVAALKGYSKNALLDRNFYSKHEHWFGGKELDPAIRTVAEGSYQNAKGYDGGIRGRRASRGESWWWHRYHCWYLWGNWPVPFTRKIAYLHDGLISCMPRTSFWMLRQVASLRRKTEVFEQSWKQRRKQERDCRCDRSTTTTTNSDWTNKCRSR